MQAQDTLIHTDADQLSKEFTYLKSHQDQVLLVPHVPDVGERASACN